MKGLITIKKISLIISSLLLVLMVACESKENVSQDKALRVSITTDVDTYEANMSSVRGITLIPKLEGETDKDIQYHWSIDSDREMFDSTNGPQKEIINDGEEVLFIVVAEIGYVEADTLSKTINVTLAIEEKGSNEVLAKTELIIEDYSGTYKVKK